jgi:tetratricopeptide (TPR) repeat protein
VLALLAGCSSASKEPPGDATLSRLGRAGDVAFNLEQPTQAAEQYQAALARARTRDDASAIADAGFNLATAQLRAGQPRAALATARRLQAELARRGISDPAFDLVAATALFRLDDLVAADTTAARLTGSPKPGLADTAWFLRGLIADRQGNRSGLATAAASLSETADAGDAAELQARLSHDRAMALHAADLRRDILDYRGMARCLALAAQYTADASSAADLYLRAARSAAAQGDTQQARAWLAAARERAPDAALRAEIDRVQRDLPRS